MAASEGSRVGVVGGGDLVAALEASGASVTAGSAAAVLAEDPDVVVADGDDALAALAGEEPSVPALAVEAGPTVPSVSRAAVGDAVAAVRAGDAGTTDRRLFAVEVGGERAATMLRDAMLITDEPARISEYGVHSGGREVARFRADGVVVATPAGSEGYLSAAGGPHVEPGTGTLAAVPVAPFQTASDHWVLDDAAVALSVHREEAVVLVVDGVETRQVPRGTPVELTPSGALALYVLDGDWKNSNGRRTE